jgi:hypothetical protein
MLTKLRWEAECRLIEGHFPAFRPFHSGDCGFEGTFSQNGVVYRIRVQAKEALYPAVQPAIYIVPFPCRNLGYLEADGRLSVCIPWNPKTGIYAPSILIPIRYLEEYGS